MSLPSERSVYATLKWLMRKLSGNRRGSAWTGTNYNIGKFGHMRCEYLKEFKHGYYMELLFDGRLNEYLHEVDEECYKMLDQLVEQMKDKQGVTEQLKAENQMLWVGRMNNIIACAEEIVVREVVYV